MNEADWQTCEQPIDLLRYLNGKIDDEAFMRFSVACCRRIWPLITDPRSRAVVDATEAYLNREITAEQLGQVSVEWDRAYQAGQIKDAAGGSTHEAIESVNGLGDGHASQVASACFEAVASIAAHRTGQSPEREQAWNTAENAERAAQCQLIRDLFDYPGN